METILSEALKNYGVIGFVVVSIVAGGTMYVNKITTHFISTTEKQSFALNQITENFFKTMHEYSMGLERLLSKHDVIHDDVKEIKKKIDLLHHK